MKIQKHWNLLTDRSIDAERILINRLLVTRLEKPIWPVHQSICALLFDGGHIADVFPFIRDSPQSIPRHCGVEPELRVSNSITLAVQYLWGKGEAGTLLLFRCRIPREFRLQFRTDGMLFVETGAAKRIDSDGIGTGIPGDGGCCHLRSR